MVSLDPCILSVTEVRNALRCPRVFALGRSTSRSMAATPGVGIIATPSALELAFDFQGDDDGQAELLASLQGMGMKVASFKEAGLALETLYMSLISDSR